MPHCSVLSTWGNFGENPYCNFMSMGGHADASLRASKEWASLKRNIFFLSLNVVECTTMVVHAKDYLHFSFSLPENTCRLKLLPQGFTIYLSLMPMMVTGAEKQF